MRLVSNQKHNIRRYLAARLVALLLERHFCARFPARFDSDAHVLVLLFRRAVRLNHTPRDLHLLYTAFVDLFQRCVQIVLDGRVLLFLLLQRRVHVERMRSERTAETVTLAAQAAERREEIRFRVEAVEDVLLEQIVGHVEERAERIAGAEELSERGSRIAMELICKIVGAVRMSVGRSCIKVSSVLIR